jgi:5-methylcytosine-specific restriction endonuclease McrA
VELRDKLQRAQDLMRHRNPNGDMAVVLERALDVLLEKLEKERLGKTNGPRRATRPASSGRITRAARREVFARDGEQCTFVDAQAQRCPARGLLELDHKQPRALDGKGDPANLRVLCRAHNQLHAEQVFGREHVARQREAHFRQRKCEPFDVATKGLVSLGFRKSEASRAVMVVQARHSETVAPPEILREALGVLT